MNEEANYPHKELSRSIIGAAMTVLNELHPGLDEKLYENALAIELHHLGHQVEQQRNFPVKYRDQPIGTLYSHCTGFICAICVICG